MCHHLRYGECHGFVFGLVHAAGDLRPFHVSLADDLVALLESAFDGGIDLFHALHLRAAERRTAHVALDETRQTQGLGYLRRVGQFLTRTEHHALGDMEAEIGEVVVAGVFVERQRSSQHTAARIRQTYHVQIALQDTVLTRRAVDGDVREIERVTRALARIRKIILVDGTGLSHQFIIQLALRAAQYIIRNGHPFLTLQHYDCHLVPLFVHKRIQTRRRTQRHLMLAAVSSGYDCYLPFHFLAINRIWLQRYTKKSTYARESEKKRPEGRFFLVFFLAFTISCLHHTSRWSLSG